MRREQHYFPLRDLRIIWHMLRDMLRDEARTNGIKTLQSKKLLLKINFISCVTAKPNEYQLLYSYWKQELSDINNLPFVFYQRSSE